MDRQEVGGMKKRVLVIATHPDDEVLGCGGTLALHANAGDHVTSVVVCEGESLRYGNAGVGQKCHMQQAAEKLGVRDSKYLDFPDQRVDTLSLVGVITPLEQVIRKLAPHARECC